MGLDASSIGTLLLSLSTIAGTEISNPSWVNFQSAGWVSFQSAPTQVSTCATVSSASKPACTATSRMAVEGSADA
ncbi:hypothetical protein CXB34_22875 [Pseudomonas amygdali pv. morsprunorum]|nr:hypothetical protein CXB34_22875 [Pseudomonas amygdali pv. morsprunorum]